MGLAVSAQTMIDAARRITKTETLDEANSCCTNAELLAVLNTELAELEDKITENEDEEYTASVWPISLVAGQSVYPLAIDDYKITGVDVVWSAQVTRSARRFTNAERNRFKNVQPAWVQFSTVYYRTLGSNIEFMPVPTSAVKVFVNYTAAFAPLVAYGDTYDSKNGWHMAAVWGLAGYIAQADADDAKAALCYAQKERQLLRVASMAASRVSGEPPRVQRTRRHDGEDW